LRTSHVTIEKHDFTVSGENNSGRRQLIYDVGGYYVCMTVTQFAVHHHVITLRQATLSRPSSSSHPHSAAAATLPSDVRANINVVLIYSFNLKSGFESC